MQIAKYMRQRKVAVMLLQETRTPQTTQYVLEGFLFIVFGSGEGREYAGVEFVVDMRVRRAIKYIDSQGARLALLAIRTGL
eukprot:9865946-Alexandrium_andersonii.AAC.1